MPNDEVTVIDYVSGEDSDQNIKVFLIEQQFGDEKYGGEICARDYTEAEALAEKIDAVVVGTKEMSVCEVCGNEIFNRLGNEQPEIIH